MEKINIVMNVTGRMEIIILDVVTRELVRDLVLEEVI